MLHAIVSENFFNISPLDDRDLDYTQMFERDGKRYLKPLADLDVEYWSTLCVGVRAYIDQDRVVGRQRRLSIDRPLVRQTTEHRGCRLRAPAPPSSM